VEVGEYSNMTDRIGAGGYNGDLKIRSVFGFPGGCLRRPGCLGRGVPMLGIIEA